MRETRRGERFRKRGVRPILAERGGGGEKMRPQHERGASPRDPTHWAQRGPNAPARCCPSRQREGCSRRPPPGGTFYFSPSGEEKEEDRTNEKIESKGPEERA